MAQVNRSGEPVRKSVYWLVIVIVLFAGGLAVSDESLWIDEAHTAYKATQPDWSSFHHALMEDGGSDTNMPVYMAFMWLWDKVVGSHPEWLFRASNVVWYAVFQLGMLAALRSRLRLALGSALAVAFSPFVWYYMNEARPYVMQLAGAGLVTAFFVRRSMASGAGTWWTVTFGVGLLVLCGSSLLGVLWAGSAIGLLGWQWWRREFVVRRGDLMAIGGTLALLAVLGSYYVRVMLLEDARPTDGETGLLNVAFSFYELLGIAGLGPWRYAIREGGFAAFQPFLLSVALSGVLLGGLLLTAVLGFWRENRRAFWPLAIAWCAPIVALFILGSLTHARVLGRHLAPALPVLMLLLGFALARLWADPRGGALAGCAILVSAASAASFRFADRHAKEDSRAALAEAAQIVASGGDVWWAGAIRLLRYYETPFRLPEEPGPGVIYLRNPSAAVLAPLPEPDAIFFSRPDIFDENHHLQHWLTAHGYAPARRWQGLTLWRRVVEEAK